MQNATVTANRSLAHISKDCYKLVFSLTQYAHVMKRFLLLLPIVALIGGFLYMAWLQIAPQVRSASTAVTASSSESPSQPAVATQAAARTAKESSQIQNLLNTFGQQYAGVVHIAVIDLDDGATGDYDATTPIVSASVYKLFVAYGIYQKIDAGDLTTNSPVTATGGTVGSCLTAMITVSDNDCGKALGDMVGWATLDSQLHAMGYTATTLNNYDKNGNVTDDKMTSASDVARFLQQLYQGKLLSQASTSALINLLKDDELNDWLPSGLPSGTVIAHKTGALYGYVHDAGIVYSPNGNYIVAMLSGEWDEPETDAPPVFAALSSQLWAYFTS